MSPVDRAAMGGGGDPPDRWLELGSPVRGGRAGVRLSWTMLDPRPVAGARAAGPVDP